MSGNARNEISVGNFILNIMEYLGVSAKNEKWHEAEDALTQMIENVVERYIEKTEKAIYCGWTIQDALDMYAEMTEEQAVAVMKYVEKRADFECGISYSSIESAVATLYPELERNDEDED